MPRAAFLTFLNEFRLLAKDRVGLFMLLLAPVAIISIAGFSLGDIYGARRDPHAYVIPVVNQDRGVLADAIIDGLKREPSIAIAVMTDLARARTTLSERDRAPLAILIPAGTTAALEAGATGHLILYVDPVKRLEVSAIELRLGELCRRVTAGARAQAQRKLTADRAELRARLERLAAQVKRLQARIANSEGEFAHRRARAQAALQAQVRQALDDLEAAIDRSTAQTKSLLAREMSARRDVLLGVNRYLTAMQASQRAFAQWLANLRAAAGSHGADIPPPPAFPAPPPTAQLAELSRPLEFAPPVPPRLNMPSGLTITLPSLPPLPNLELPSDIGALAAAVSPTLPGDLTWRERSVAGGSAETNAFDQYVPGFGVTFLLIGMLMGIGLGLIDERDWGTLQRLRVSGAALVSVLIGKVVARFLVGLLQMIVLFVLGWLLFGITLGRDPLALMIPTAAICFAGAAFGLVIACIARTHDSVMPFGAVVAMAMSAIGGCWWPLDFEPSWMRTLAQWMPTTWAMQGYNNLMIRHLATASVLSPSAAAFALGILYLALGFIGARRLYE
jgi:ABC-type multidrug transport system permease subunit